ncbi:MAG: hypothetical protein CMF62_00780 [Magnetococcales bacterium]|nr:hypothetical protein [Magnetococcales bacterium]
MAEENNFIKSFATLLSSYLLKYFGIETIYFPVLLEITNNLIKSIINFKIDQFSFDINTLFKYLELFYHFLLNNSIHISIISISSLLLLYFYNYSKKDNKIDDTYQLLTYDRADLSIILKHMDLFPEKFSPIKNFVNGDSDVTVNKLQKSTDLYWSYLYDKDYPESGSKITINDEEFNINGYLIWDKTLKEITMNSSKDDDEKKKLVKKVIPIPFCRFIIYSKNKPLLSIREYFNKMKLLNDSKLSEKQRIVLYHHPLMFKSTEREGLYSIFYDGRKMPIQDRKKKYIDTFFHEKRDEIWDVLHKINYQPDFFINLGQVARMGIIAYGPPGTGKSSFAYRIAMALERHIFTLNLKSIKNKKALFKIFECPRSNTGVSYRPDKVIFVFDEFDHGIKFLYNRQVDRNRELKKLEMMTEMTYGNELNQQEINEKKEEFNEKRFDMMMNDELCLNDLLDIFQGAVPINGVICIATTNDLESIKKLSPALVRP